MAQLKSKSDRPNDLVLKSRALNATILTTVFIFAVVLSGIHLLWAVKVLYYKTYGGFLNNLILGPGTFVANVVITFKVLTYLNEKILGDNIDADHKKYI